MTRYWAGYGISGFVGCFDGAEGYARGEDVEVQSPRGREVATILDAVNETFAVKTVSDGRILSHFQGETGKPQDLFTAVESAAAAMPMIVPDVELLLDGTLIVHAMVLESVDLTDWLSHLSTSLQRPVRLLNMAELPEPEKPPEAKGCGKEGCGSGGGCSSCSSGCGTGSCSKGKVKSAEELTAYFSGLWTQMDSRRTNLV